jgi:hypothetical protein
MRYEPAGFGGPDSENTVGWLESEIDEWIESRPDASSTSTDDDDDD